MGAGKSTALGMLEELGAAVLSTDAVVHELYRTEQLRKAVVDRWGDDVAPAAVVDRSAVAARAFADESERKWLESLLWPMVATTVSQWLVEVRSQEPAPKAAVVETPLLFEAGMQGIYDHTIAVIASEPLRSARASTRGHALTDERSSRQLPQDEKARRADFTVRNDGDLGELREQLQSILERLSTSTAAR
jgi:dephospho-CoA kinase